MNTVGSHERRLPKLSAAFQRAMAAGDARGALEIAEQMVAIAQRYLGPEHPDYAITLSNLGAAHYANGDAEQAIGNCARRCGFSGTCMGSTMRERSERSRIWRRSADSHNNGTRRRPITTS